MPSTQNSALGHARVWFGRLADPQLLAFVPAVVVTWYWFGAQAALILSLLALPVYVMIARTTRRARLPQGRQPTDGLTGLALRAELIGELDRFLVERRDRGLSTACLALEIDEFKELGERHGPAAAETAIRKISERLSGVLRDGDIVARLDGATFGVMLSPVRVIDLEGVIQLASRIQGAVGEPIPVDSLTLYVSCSVGFCQSSRTEEDDGGKMLLAAENAMIEARRSRPGSIRAFSKEMKKRLKAHQNLMEDARVALELGQISAWYQPQISTETGQVTGFEALARWAHPERGLIPPVEFLPAVQEAGLYSRLGEVMMYNALSALKNWDRAGLKVPSVAVNFSDTELRDPKLMEKVRWELDRFSLTPDRLTIEILEDVVADNEDDTIPSNIRSLSEIGCKIDLDDFGTGHASIASIRRFAINRIKIDRSFIAKIDQDPDQQRMLSAILMMAERLELETLAEGVESLGERSVLAQLGCSHIQGYGIARPMPFDETLVWLPKHDAKLGAAPDVGREAG
ncbi:MAG: bifunctional diguanylate cyclase/phosphodiesterase [Pseudomonadota bacterium]